MWAFWLHRLFLLLPQIATQADPILLERYPLKTLPWLGMLQIAAIQYLPAASQCWL